MVAELIIPEGFKQETKLARVLFTGTTRQYLLDVFTKWGNFSHNRKGAFVYLDITPANAICYAVKRSVFYKDKPVVLIVDSEKLEGKLYYSGQHKIDAINIGSFLTYELFNKDGKYEKDYYRIKAMGNKVIKYSKEELWQNFSRYLRKY